MALQGLASGQVRFRFRAPGALAAVLVAAAGAANDDYAAPYVPTVEEDVELMLDIAQAGSGDYVIDLGSGDGRIVIAAGRRGAVSHGVEIDLELARLARRNAAAAGVTDRTAFFEGDIFDADIARASVVTLYLFPEVNIALRPKLLAELAPGTRVVSNSFDMGDWAPDVHDRSARSSGGIMMWIVPADVAGPWMLEIEGESDGDGPLRGDGAAGAAGFADVDGCTLRIDQVYQRVDGRLDACAARSAAPRVSGDLYAASLRGERFTFEIAIDGHSHTFVGRVDDDAMHGYVQIDGADGKRLARWRATRQ